MGTASEGIQDAGKESTILRGAFGHDNGTGEETISGLNVVFGHGYACV